jgi:hypothetical protein
MKKTLFAVATAALMGIGLAAGAASPASAAAWHRPHHVSFCDVHPNAAACYPGPKWWGFWPTPATFPVWHAIVHPHWRMRAHHWWW